MARALHEPEPGRLGVRTFVAMLEDEFVVKTNYTNCFEIKNSLIKPEIFLVTKKFLGIPMFISTNKNHVSFEHTHPPHEYILSQNKFKKISELKKEVNEIIS